MKLYRVTVPGRSWTMTAPNIQAASQFVKHCPAVRLRTICPWTPTHVALVDNPPDPECRII